MPLGVGGEIQAASLRCVQLDKTKYSTKYFCVNRKGYKPQNTEWNNLGFTFVLLIRAVNES